MNKPNYPLVHWSDITADRIIRQRGDKEVYTLASGITPSGIVHFGNFRETITVDLVANALRKRGKKVRFIFSWDDYDTFRKVPKNMPKQELLESYLFRPIVETPDPYEKEDSYAAHHEKAYEKQLDKVGIKVEPIYQAKKYRNGDYSDQIIETLKRSDEIRNILDEHRTSPLPESWLPVSIYCENCKTDKVGNSLNFVDGSKIEYVCENCGHQSTIEIKNSDRVKLPWRLDWPMRWVYESVDFEPGGKDHSSQGGSYSTGKVLVKEIYGGEAPIYLQYDFVSIKGGTGKMSSSSGEVVTVNDVLEIYEPEILRYIFASYKTNIDFSVSFDLDVLKIYEDFDKMERVAFGLEKANEKKTNMAKRVYELSQVGEMPATCPIQPSFRHLCNILQIHDGDIEKAKTHYIDQINNEWDEKRFKQRAKCALSWLKLYAPDDFKFSINKEKENELNLSNEMKGMLSGMVEALENNEKEFSTDKELHEKIYEVIHQHEACTPQEVFKTLYEILISKEKGPKLAGFIRTIGFDQTLKLIREHL